MCVCVQSYVTGMWFVNKMPALLFSQLFDYSQSTRTHLHADNVLLADRDRDRERAIWESYGCFVYIVSIVSIVVGIRR